MTNPDVFGYSITVHRSELLPGGRGALIGYSDDYPDHQFLVIPKVDDDQPE